MADGDAQYIARLREIKNWLRSQPNLLATRYGTFKTYEDFNHHVLADDYGNLTAEGLALGGWDVYATIYSGGQVGDNCQWVASTNIPGATIQWFVDGEFRGYGYSFSSQASVGSRVEIFVSNAADDASAYKDFNGNCSAP